MQVKHKGFTLAEMLIALALIGIIAALLIPKLLGSTNGNAKRSTVLQSAMAITHALEDYSEGGTTNSIKASTSATSLMPYFNYIEVVTTGNLDGTEANGPGGGESTWDCASEITCLRMHSGGYLGFLNGGFGNSANPGAPTTGNPTDLNSIWLLVDTDGSPSINGKASDSNNSIWLVLYPTGKIKSWSTIDPGTAYINNSGALTAAVPLAASDPDWFYW